VTFLIFGDPCGHTSSNFFANELGIPCIL
jgi:hypothetical protein